MGIFGRSIDIFDPNFGYTEDDQKILMQAAWLRLQTEPGTYFEDPDYGLLVSDLVNSDMTQQELSVFAARVQNQLALDDRLAETRVVAENMVDKGSNVIVDLTITLVPHTGDGFTFTVSLTETDNAIDIILGRVTQ